MSTPTDELGASTYVLLTTYRKDGRAVPTPVWTVPVPGGLGVWTVADSGKVKRIRRSPAVTVGTCDVRGNHAGPAHAARAEILPRETEPAVRAALVRKYGLMGRIGLWASRLRRGRNGTVCLLIRLEPGSD